MVVKNAVVIQNIKWQKFTTGSIIGHSFKYKTNLKPDFIPYALALNFRVKKRRPNQYSLQRNGMAAISKWFRGQIKSDFFSTKKESLQRAASYHLNLLSFSSVIRAIK